MMLWPPRTKFRGLTDRFGTGEDRSAILLSLVIGLLVGLVVVAFILLTGRLAARVYPNGSAAWRRVLIPTFGSLITGWLLYRFFPNARGSGIPQTKYALFINNGYISTKTVLGKFFCCSASLASGIALGREGPSVQIGAGIASILGRRFGLSNKVVKDLVPMGCSAALATAFNTPIAAVLFSLEEILGNLHAAVIGGVVISSATAWMVLHAVLGDEPLFHVPTYQLVNPIEFAVYAALGAAGGLGSVAFVKLLLKLRILFRKLPQSTVWFQPVAGGLFVGIVAWFVPEVMGVGYDYVERVLGGDFPLKTVALLAVLKIVATPMCYSSGNAGGIFGPALFIGAMIGGTVGQVAHHLLPGLTAGPGAYALIGMGTAFAGIVRTPLTSVIMIFEMTRDYSIIVPLMISNLIAFTISYRLQREPIYEALALQEGVYLPAREDLEELAGMQVCQVMRTEFEPLSPTLDLAAAKKWLEEQGRNAWPVGKAQTLDGFVTLRQIEDKKDAPDLETLIRANGAYPFVHGDQPVSLALERMGHAGVDSIPVVSRINLHQAQGVVLLSEALASYGVKAG
jgi:CIC family chloride channel protein